ncbi:alpha/beta hydrolase-fold protein [Dietzia sp. B32]|uniref:alpha/beta hydrolase-fold protein n=1 Tax=Dietzia sp. B32 TaxID=2915130 RepID=UPI0021ADD6B6|nr:alpha/beta hydrolase-fold protein [Dietzia sp. B32]UVE94301.1 alpha/beta hydrolase-fold protein [Dietzia sp. B32]
MATPSAHASPRSRWTSLLAAPLVASVVGSGLVLPPVAAAQETPVRPTQGQTSPAESPARSTPAESPANAPEAPSLRVPSAPPSGVRLDKVEWKSANRVALWVQSPAMKQAIQVQLMLPAQWNADPERTYPSLLLLDGLRARDDASGWTLETKISQFFDAKNAVIVLPVGGESSFYTDWVADAKGSAYQWETFLMQELPPLLARDWRVGDKHGVAGLSMGGTAAMMLSQRYPDHFDFAASYSGFLDTTSFGMPEAVKVAMQDAGGYPAENMWGPLGSRRWQEQDPKLHTERMRGQSVYVSAGSGNTGPWDQPSGLPDIPTNFPGYGLELLSRMTTQTFVNRARAAGVEVTANFRPSGTHTWPYWQFEMTQAWPQFATAVGIENVEKPCAASGDIARLAERQPGLGPCLTGEYDVRGGKATDFRFGRVFWSQQTGAHSVLGAIGAAYQAEGGPDGVLGLPTSGETATPDGRGRFSTFQNGVIYWSPTTGAHAVRGGIRAMWQERGSERGELGYPTTDEITNPNKPGVVQGFQGGTVYWSEETGPKVVEGAILQTYREAGAENSELGYPTTDEIALSTRRGAFNRFQGGAIYWSPRTGAHVVPRGPVFDAWGTVDYERGRLGYPTGPLRNTRDGQVMEFEGGSITVSGGRAEISS